MKTVDLLVVGGGAAGMAVALAAAEGGRVSVLLAERGARLGGVLPQCLHSGFGRARFGQDMTGATYGERYSRMVEASAVQVRLRTAVLALRKDKTALLSGPDGLERIVFCRCVLAVGCRETPAGALNIAGTRPAGVFTAGEAQRLVNLGRYDIGSRFVFLGSGDIGQIVARDLYRQGKEIAAMIEQNDCLGGMPRNRRECVEACRIPVILRATVDEVQGAQRVSGVMIRHLDTGARERVACDTLVTAVGLCPEQELAAPLLNEKGELPEWVVMCGNCAFVHDVVDTVSLEGEAMGKELGRGVGYG